MTRPTLISLLALAAVPASAAEAYLCRFDVACTANGCAPQDRQIEIARADGSGAWVFRGADDTGLEGVALPATDEAVQVIALHDPTSESVLVSLYPDGRAILSTHNINTATPPALGFGACEEVTG